MISQNAGEIVELAVRRKNINISELSRKMKVNRRTLYNWFQQETLTSAVIHSISQAIDYDFSQEFPEDFLTNRSTCQKTVEEDNATEAGGQQYYWMKKYITLLEDYRLLLEKYNNSISQTPVDERRYYKYS
ncbi:MAG: helix-turn-helix domain-containing protein [Pedobacter sp.]|uniref:helix-turn-helix domain-containing protein n=1 Tax=Pedobacter sp. TaxID=1411316 RepID=UPI003397A5EA